jgi:putative MATE family efflux protein
MERISFIDLEKSGYKNIWFLAWPVMVSQILLTTLNIVDMFWIGKLGPSHVAGVAIAGSLIGVIHALSQIFYAGNIAMVARFAGRNEKDSIKDVIVHSFIIAFILSLVISTGGLVFMRGIFSLFGTSEDVLTLGIQYMRIIYLGIPFFFCSFVVFATLTGLGDTKTPTKITAFASVLNIILDPFLIFGLWRFPRLGVQGAAIATTLSFFISFLLGLAILLKRRYLEYNRIQLRWSTIGRLLKIGVPASLNRMTRPFTGMIMFRVVAFYGTPAIAAFGIGMRTYGLMFIYFIGLTIATQTLVGQSLGLQRPQKAEEIVKKVLRIGFAIQLPVVILYFLLAPLIISIFNSDPEVIRIGTNYLRIISPSLILIVLITGLSGAQSGAGDTKPPMIASIVANWIFKIPLAYIIARYLRYASRGVWIAIAVSVVIETVIVTVYYYRGGWKKRKI